MRFTWIAGAAASAALLTFAACENRDKTGERSDRQPATTAARPADTVNTTTEGMQTANAMAMVRQANEGEIEAGRLAADRGSSAEVKALAKRMVDEHSQTVTRATELTSSKKLDVQAAKNDVFFKAKEAEHREHMDRLRGLSGAAFDSAYIAALPASHAFVAALADQGEHTSNDTDIDGFFRTARDQARDHYARALAILPKDCGGMGTSLLTAAGAPGSEREGTAGTEAGDAGAGALGTGRSAEQRGTDTTGRQRTGTGTGMGTGTGTGTGTAPHSGTKSGPPQGGTPGGTR